jgi:hypothetical protein
MAELAVEDLRLRFGGLVALDGIIEARTFPPDPHPQPLPLPERGGIR